MSIERIFGGTKPLFVTDSAEAVEWLRGRGHAATSAVDLATDDELCRREAVVFAGCDYDNLDAYVVERRMKHAAILWSPVGSFNGSAAAAIYGLERLLASDLQDAASRNNAWMDFYANTEGPVRAIGEGTDITCWISDPLFVATHVRPEMSPGEWLSIGSFLEVNCEAVHENQVVFNVTGTLRATGMLAARHLQPSAIDVAAKHRVATAFVEDIGRNNRVVEIEFEDSMLTACTVDGIDQLDFVVDLAGPLAGARVTEFAIGTNHALGSTVDWGVNSQMNEGVGGVHVGIGEGVTGVHLDFIAPDVEVAA